LGVTVLGYPSADAWPRPGSAEQPADCAPAPASAGRIRWAVLLAHRSGRARPRPGLRVRSVLARRPRPLSSRPAVGFPAALTSSANPHIPAAHSGFLTLFSPPRLSQPPPGPRPSPSQPADPRRATSPPASAAPLDALLAQNGMDTAIRMRALRLVDFDSRDAVVTRRSCLTAIRVATGSGCLRGTPTPTANCPASPAAGTPRDPGGGASGGLHAAAVW
jgi:hypothetical protein